MSESSTEGCGGELGRRALKHLDTGPGNSPLKQLSILTLSRGFVSELDPALTLEALFIPNQSPGNPRLALVPPLFLPAQAKSPKVCTLADGASVVHLVFGSLGDYSGFRYWKPCLEGWEGWVEEPSTCPYHLILWLPAGCDAPRGSLGQADAGSNRMHS